MKLISCCTGSTNFTFEEIKIKVKNAPKNCFHVVILQRLLYKDVPLFETNGLVGKCLVCSRNRMPQSFEQVFPV